MRIQNKQRYPIRYLSIFAILISIVIAKTSCKKNDLLTNENSTQLNVRINQFFNLPSNVNPAVARVAKELERQNQKTGFISTLATQAGFPVWDKSSVKLIKNNNSSNSNSLLEDYKGADTCILIPMVLIDANHVNAFISATIIDDSVTMRMYYKNDYKAYPFKATQPATGITTAEEFASQMMSFDKAVFGYTKFEIKDKKLFLPTQNYKDTSFAKGIATITSTQQSNLILCQQVEIVITVCNTPTYFACADADGCDICGNGVCYQIISSAESCTNVPPPGGGGWPSAPPPGPGGTGGGGGPTGGGNCNVGGLILEGWAPPNPCYPPTGGNPLPPVPPNPPCSEFITSLEANTNFIDRMKYLNTATVLNAPNEVGYTIRDITQYNSNSYIPGTGSATSPIIDWSFPGGTKVEGLIHSHYSGLNSIFSHDDVILMARLFLANFAKDTNNLFFAMTSKDSPPFLMKVGNASTFRTFCEKIVGVNGNDEEKMKTFARKCVGKIDSDDFYTNEKEFLKIIKELGAENGLILYRGDENFNKWTKRKVDAYGDVSSIECTLGQ